MIKDRRENMILAVMVRPTKSACLLKLWYMLPVWLSGSEIFSINVVTLHWARLVPGWVTDFRQVNQIPGYRS